jgi:hypothetical protein
MNKTVYLLPTACCFAALLVTLTPAPAGSAPVESAAGAPLSAAGGTTGVFVSTVDTVLADNQASHEESSDYVWDVTKVVPITLSGTTISATGAGVTVSGNKATITSAGTYSLSGTLTDGQITVSAASQIVRLIFNGMTMAYSTNAPINIQAAKKVIIVLAENTTNTLTDPATYVFPDASTDEPNAALYSKCDMTICGGGTLTVNGNYNDGITSKDGLVIAGGNITVKSVDDGIRGKDYLIIRDGTITVKATGDGFKADNDEDADRGYIWVAGGKVTITSGDDAMMAESDMLVSDGTINVVSGGGSSYMPTSTTDPKGLVGNVFTVIDGGTITISSSDDALHSNRHLVINGGNLTISSGDDGVHADSTLGINGSVLTISKCYEGIESKNVAINNGTIHLVASDDGINGAGGTDQSGVPGWPGQPPIASGNYFLYINGGYIAVDATGDGIDVNGTILMTDGTVIVHGPTNDGNGALDYDRAFTLTGGFLVAAGSSGMAQAPGTTSTQNSLLVNFSSRNTGKLFNITSASGENLLTFLPSKSWQSVAFSSPKLAHGAGYIAYYGGSATGTATDGLYSGGSYTPGTKYAKFTISSVVTKITRTTDVEEAEVAIPAGFRLDNAYPNPFNPQTSIRFQLERDGETRLSIYNLLGEEVARLVDGPMTAGVHTRLWLAADQPSGIYWVRLTAGAKTATQRIMLVK